jgi:hypothetical protein
MRLPTTSLNGGWDEELLGLELGELQILGFDLDLTGFSDQERAAPVANPGSGRPRVRARHPEAGRVHEAPDRRYASGCLMRRCAGFKC